jgi:Family of unknown function (DUF5681)
MGSGVQNNIETRGGVTGKGFRPGQSGNPGGRPKGLARATRELVGDDGLRIARFWLDTMLDETQDLRLRLEASRLLADRGWVKALDHEPLVENESVDDPRLGLDETDREIERLSAEIAARAAEPSAQR